MWRIGDRLRVLWQSLNPAFGWIAIAMALLSTITLVQQEFLPHPYCDYRVFDFLPHFGWQGWLIAFLALVGVSAIEALYQHRHAIETIQRYPQRPARKLVDSIGQLIESPPVTIERGRFARLILPSVIVASLTIVWIGQHISFKAPLTSSNTVPQPAPTASPEPPDNTAVFVESSMTSVPVKVLPHSSIYVIPIDRMLMTSNGNYGHWGFREIPNNGDRPILWPNKALMEKAKKEKLPGVFGYRFVVSNDGPSNIRYLFVPIDFWFGGNSKDRFRYEAVVSDLNVGQSFSFYVFNDCPMLAAAIWQQDATIQTAERPNSHPCEAIAEVPQSNRSNNDVLPVQTFMDR